jgi:hypothetical protein
MHKETEGGKLTEALRDIPLREMCTLSDYEEAGVDVSVIVGDEDQLRNMVCYFDISGNTFTTYGKLKEKRIAKFLKKIKKKRRIYVQILCMR